jgi:hypothetical protein
MIREIKQKKSKFGTIISSHVTGIDSDEHIRLLESMNAFSAFVTIHTNDDRKNGANGITYVKAKNGPKLKVAIGHHISQIRGDQLVAFVNPKVVFLDNIARVYDYAEANRMERSYGFFLGDQKNPSVVALTGSVVPHLFHAVPEQMSMEGVDWIKWIHEWTPKAIMKHRYFDANHLVGIMMPRAVDPASVAISLVDSAPEPQSIVEEAVVKKKPGRPKTKK